jgi:hypothetical protein
MIDRRWPPAAAGAALIVGSALAFALDGPVAQAAYQHGLDPATFGIAVQAVPTRPARQARRVSQPDRASA